MTRVELVVALVGPAGRMGWCEAVVWAEGVMGQAAVASREYDVDRSPYNPIRMRTFQIQIRRRHHRSRRRLRACMSLCTELG